jgi:hypothetical protein
MMPSTGTSATPDKGLSATQALHAGQEEAAKQLPMAFNRSAPVRPMPHAYNACHLVMHSFSCLSSTKNCMAIFGAPNFTITPIS